MIADKQTLNTKQQILLEVSQIIIIHSLQNYFQVSQISKLHINLSEARFVLWIIWVSLDQYHQNLFSLFTFFYIDIFQDKDHKYYLNKPSTFGVLAKFYQFLFNFQNIFSF
ncbi:hypothetical protein TTHERM_000562812 (macronuclear) [Tetrahymena thermophila SB210]|uniref:Uncharacterized protein n=1 Tax=Tetrahymena thermophila (strain SB210) TaxID=312017 RepID=W7XL93_TETTS|nr:hypothetical protein TTHERM_000562812 [Tetrahymena thermophila SB210]EWS75889.1 hypothetical protein TTHERM_000562812 [Tetrahymena thermophila SB210]|eukprot:XP_012651592.1 hypothetical protein TTHERM_000562812 [Tetrahymena thermophila SB210]